MVTASDESVVAPTSAWAPLRNKVFFALWVAQLASNLGTLMQSVGAAWLMGDLGASSALVAMVQTATFLPVFLVGIPAGVLADLFDRRRVLLVTQLGMMVAAGAMAALTFSETISPSGVLGLTFLLGMFAALMSPAWMAIQPDLVGKEQFGQAVALNSMTYNLARSVGPAIGGLIIAGAGPGWVFLLNGLSFVGTFLVLLLWRPAAADVASAPTETFTGAAVAGLRYGVHSRLVRIALVRVALLILPGVASQALLPIIVRGPLDWGSGGYGILLGCFGVGATLGAIARPRLILYLHPDAVVAVATVLMTGMLLVQGFVHNRWAVGVALFAGGSMWSVAITATTVAAQSAMPSWVRARGMALYSLVMTGSVAIGAAAAGLLANWSLEGAHLVAAIVMLVGLLAPIRYPLTWDREFDMTLIPGDVPQVVMAPEPDDGPVLVTVTYRVGDDDLESFAGLMRGVESHRRRTGAFRWTLYRDLADPDRFIETFLVSSWAEHLRQHHRTTASTDVLLRHLRPFIDPTARAIGHYLSTSSKGGLAPHGSPASTEVFDDEI